MQKEKLVVMAEEKKNGNANLVRSDNDGLTMRSANMIRRGLSSLQLNEESHVSPTFDEKIYSQARPHFEAILEHCEETALSARDVLRLLIKTLIQFNFNQEVVRRMKPYILRFVEEYEVEQLQCQTMSEKDSASPE